MSPARIPSRLCCDLQRLAKAVWGGPRVAGGRCPAPEPMDSRRLQLTVEPDRAVVACHSPRAAGAGVALALADRVAALFRGQSFGPFRFASPSVDLDGRDPDGFRAVVTVPIRYCVGACPSRLLPPAGCSGTAPWATSPGT